MYIYVIMLFRKKIKEKEEIDKINKKIEGIEEELNEILAFIEGNQEKSEEKEKKTDKNISNEEDLSDINVYIKKISQAKSPQEVEALRYKRRLLMQIRRAEAMRLHNTYQNMGRKKKTEEKEIKEEGDENMDINKIWDVYEGLNPVVKKLVNGYVKNKFNIDIEDLKNDPSKLLEILNSFLKSQEKQEEKTEDKEKENKYPLTPEEIKKRADELEKQILEEARKK